MRLIERSPVVIGAVTLAVIAAVTAAALAVERGMLVGGYHLTAEFAHADGLAAGDPVLISGVRVGEVESLAIAGDHVEATLRIEGSELGADATGQIAVRSLVGNRAVELDAGSDFDDPLTHGDTIPLARTRQPRDLAELGDASQQLLSQVDSRALNRLVVALDDVVAGQRQELSALIDGGTDLSRTVNDQQAQIRSLLQRLSDLGETLNQRDDELVAIIDDVDAALARLNARREDLRALVRETRATAGQAADLVAAERSQLDAILTDLHDITDVLAQHQMDLAEGLAYAGSSLQGFASVNQAGDEYVPWGSVLVQSAGPVGVDVLLSCGGVLDQQLTQLLGPDPRSCAEQADQSMPDDIERGEGVLDGLTGRSESGGATGDGGDDAGGGSDRGGEGSGLRGGLERLLPPSLDGAGGQR